MAASKVRGRAATVAEARLVAVVVAAAEVAPTAQAVFAAAVADMRVAVVMVDSGTYSRYSQNRKGIPPTRSPVHRRRTDHQSSNHTCPHSKGAEPMGSAAVWVAPRVVAEMGRAARVVGVRALVGMAAAAAAA